MPEQKCRAETSNVYQRVGLHKVTTVCVVEESACCAEDTSHAEAAKWQCDDKCSTCSCSGGTVSATGCNKGSGAPDGQPPEAYFVQLALAAVAVCFLAFGAVCWIMLCCRRKATLLPSKEMKSPEEEEEDQLAAGD